MKSLVAYSDHTSFNFLETNLSLEEIRKITNEQELSKIGGDVCSIDNDENSLDELCDMMNSNPEIQFCAHVDLDEGFAEPTQEQLETIDYNSGWWILDKKYKSSTDNWEHISEILS